MATASNPVKFMGPAATSFQSFSELSLYSLDNYCPDWRKYEHPQNYIFPPVFSFQNPRIGDAEFKEIDAACPKEKKGENPVIKFRNSEEAEHMVFEAIFSLVQEKSETPFIAVHSANLDKLKRLLPHMFPKVKSLENYTSCIREYDFLLIGPKIGFIAVEVKHSFFTQKKHFTPSCKFLPDDINKGLKQLGSVENLLEMLQEATEVPKPSKVRKVLFMPNLEANRYHSWFRNLDQTAKDAVEKRRNDVQLFFKGPQVLLRGCLMVENPIPEKVYETYGSLLAGLTSTIATEDIQLEESCRSETIRLEESRFSEAIVALDVSEKVTTQNPDGQENQEKKQKKQKTVASTQPKPVELIHGSKIIQLTPDQQKALEGPNRHIIIGAAGTGKTIILQEKALSLLRDQRKILVFAPKSYMKKYQALFKHHGFKKHENFDIRCWNPTSKLSVNPAVAQKPGYELVDERQISKITSADPAAVYNFMQCSNIAIDCLDTYDAIFIDDTLDAAWHRLEFTTCLKQILALMAYCKIRYPEKVVWVAMDSFMCKTFSIEEHYLCSRNLKAIFEFGKDSDAYYVCTVLSNVMRCAENIFKQFYRNASWPSFSRPLSGHKIPGIFRRIDVICSGDYYTDEVRYWRKIMEELRRAGANPEQVAVIFGDNNPKLNFIRDKIFSHKDTVGNSMEKDDYNFQKATVLRWNEVSSLEWPIVICACNTDGYGYEYTPASYDMYGLSLYRACSRATGELILINPIKPRNSVTIRGTRRAESYPSLLPIRQETSWFESDRNEPQFQARKKFCAMTADVKTTVRVLGKLKMLVEVDWTYTSILDGQYKKYKKLVQTGTKFMCRSFSAADFRTCLVEEKTVNLDHDLLNYKPENQRSRIFWKAFYDNRLLLEQYLSTMSRAERPKNDSYKVHGSMEAEDNIGALIAETFDVVDKSVRHYLIRKICKILDSVHDQTLDHVKSSGAVLTISQSIPDATTADDSTSVHGMFGQFVTNVLKLVPPAHQDRLKRNIRRLCVQAAKSIETI